ncbi:IclR family transcriptional regulator C-terminal domain-containing protein [Acinetobacter thermotolerans]|uniref:IclR family transcriptional regulator n=1 Tax=Acinetobacter thermotolerans TaxID=3151487 RepID=UPI00325A69E9
MSSHQRGIQTVEFSGKILQLVCSSPKALSLSEIAETMQLAPGSAYKYLVSLLRTGLLKRNPSTLEFEAGSLSLRLGLSKINHDATLVQVRHALTNLAEKYQLNVFASMWSKINGPTVMFYKETGGFFHIGFRLGIRLSLNRTASGRIFAAYQDLQSLNEYSQRIGESEYTVLKQAEFQDTLQQIRIKGYSSLAGTPTPDITSYAVPVFDATGKFIMAITAFCQSEAINEELEEVLITDLKTIAASLKEQKHG